VLGKFLFGVTPTDAVTFTAVIVLLAVVAILAGTVPARRAAAVDPLVALRQE
jgi:ABC-type lipoprotein release transport system permease subunit